MIIQNIIENTYPYQPTWVMLVIVLSLMLLGYLYSAFNSRFLNFIRAVFNPRYSAQASREERSLSHPVSMLLSLNFILTVSLFILQMLSSGIFSKSKIEFTLTSYFLIAGSVFCIYLVKLILIKVFAFIFDKNEIIAEYNFIIFLVNQFLGIALIPSIIFIAYGPKLFTEAVFYFGAITLSLTLIFRVGKGIVAVLDKREFTPFYLILYLCTLEILPLLVGIKLFEELV